MKLSELINETIGSELKKLSEEKSKFGKVLSEGLRFHLDNKIPLTNNIYRPGTKKYFSLFREARALHIASKLSVSKLEEEILNTNIGEFGMFENESVPLDWPMMEEDVVTEAEHNGKDVELNKPKRGGSKKFYVYVKCGDSVKKVSFGSKEMSMRISEPERRKSFVARHNCKEKNDKCSAGYWACRIGRYPHLTGAKKSYAWW